MTPGNRDHGTILARLHAGRFDTGLPEAAARALDHAFDGGAPVAAALAAAGLGGRLAAVLERAEAPDPRAALARLAPLAAEVEVEEGRLRAAGTYPLLLAATVGILWVTMGAVGAPALSVLPGGPATRPFAWLGSGIAASLGLLGILSAVVLGRVRAPWLSAGWTLVERFAFAATLGVLAEAGSPVPASVRAAGAFTRGRSRDAAEGLARALEAGAGPPDARPVLHPFEASVLFAAAADGSFAAAAAALAEQQRIALARGIPEAVVRIHAAALVLAGATVLALGATWYGAYSRALAG